MPEVKVMNERQEISKSVVAQKKKSGEALLLVQKKHDLWRYQNEDCSVSKVHKTARIRLGMVWRIHIVFSQHIHDNAFNLLRDCTDFV